MTIATGALLCAALLLGCGGGGDEASISKAEFVKQANALCAASQKQMQAEIVASLKQVFRSKSKDGGAAGGTEEAVLKGFKAELEGIEELGSPKGYEAEAEKVVDALSRVVDELESDPAQFRRTAGKVYKNTQKTAAKYGLDACGSPIGT